MRVRTIGPSELEAARAILGRALPFDRVDVVAEEKLFGREAKMSGATFGAFDDRGALVGVAAIVGRDVKLLAVAPEARGRGFGGALLDECRAWSPNDRLRYGAHAGNYLTPGLDVRYAEGRAFLEKRGFRVVGEVENIRAPDIDGANPLVSEARSRELDERARSLGYTIARAGDDNLIPLLEWLREKFAWAWAFEARRAYDGPRRALHVALQHDSPVAFAAADGNNQGLGWFGPAGTDPAHRGRGLGEALLVRCLLDVRGLPEGGVIAWIGPKEFYRKSCGAVEDRRFLSIEMSSEPKT